MKIREANTHQPSCHGSSKSLNIQIQTQSNHSRHAKSAPKLAYSQSYECKLKNPLEKKKKRKQLIQTLLSDAKNIFFFFFFKNAWLPKRSRKCGKKIINAKCIDLVTVSPRSQTLFFRSPKRSRNRFDKILMKPHQHSRFLSIVFKRTNFPLEYRNPIKMPFSC